MKPLKEYIKQILNKLHRNHKKVEVNEEDSKNFIVALVRGYYEHDGDTYLCTVDNCITCLFDPNVTGIDEAALKDLIEQMKKDGKTPKYETVKDGRADAKKNGWIIAQRDSDKIYIDKPEKKPVQTANNTANSTDEDIENIKIALTNGFYVHEDGEHYLCTVDNVITCLFNPEETGVDEKALNNLIKQMKQKGKKPKYATVNDGKADAKKYDWHVLEYKDGVVYMDGKKYTD